MRTFNSIEVLEPRIAPASVTATFAAGKLKILGDASANIVSFGIQTDGFTLNTGAGSNLIFNGEDLGDAGSTVIRALVNDITVDLGGGDDSLESFGGSFAKNINIKGGAGNDTIKTASVRTGGTFTIDGGEGDDTLMLESELQAAKLAVDLGAGTNQLQFNYTNLTVEGDTVIKGGVGVDTITTTVSATFRFGNNLNIALGGGNDSIGFGQTVGTAPEFFGVGGKFSIIQGAHDGAFNVNFNATHLRFGGDFSLTTDGKNGGTNNVNFGGSTVLALGKMNFKSTGTSVDNYVFNPATLNLAGAVSADLGDGNNTVTLGALFNNSLGALSYKGGAGDDKIIFGSVPISVTGLTDVKLGDGTNEFSEVYAFNTGQTLVFGGGLAVTGGKDSDTVSLDVYDLSIGGKGVNIALGNSNGTALIKSRNTLNIYGSFNSTSGSGDVDVTLEGAYLNVHKGVSATFGTGEGELNINGGRAEVNGGLKFTATGAGNDELTVNASRLVIKGATTVKGDVGALNVNVGITSAFTLGDVSITTKAGGGTTVINGGGDIYGKFTYTGGTGANNLDIGRETFPTVFLHDAFKMTSAATTGIEALKLHNLTALASVTAKFGGAANSVAIDNATLLGVLSLDTGAGDDTINIGNDGLITGNVLTYAAFKVLTSAGNDTVNLGGARSFQIMVPVASTLIDGGEGNDTVNNNQVYDAVTIFIPTEKNFEVVGP